MNNIQDQLVDIVNYAIRGEQIEQNQIENYNWNDIVKYAELHHVNALIYSALPNQHSIINMNKEVFEQWKKETLLTAIWQLQHINQVENMLNNFNEKNISVIVLKGLVIRELYPRPEFRTMCDADILVKESDLDATKALMESLGYTEGESSPIHISYNKKNYNHVEIHWTIEDKRFFTARSDSESKMWDSAVKVKVGRCQVLSFSTEDLAIHLCLHMASHILTSGFGIRQLCDLVLLVDKRGHLINWESFCDKARDWKIEKFIIVIFLACKKLFNITIPVEIQRYSNNIDNKLVVQLINDILSGGVYGKKDLANVFANEFAYGFKGEQGTCSIGVLKRFLYLVFPPIAMMPARYNYANRYKILIPVAWLHHLFSGITHSRYGIIDKVKFLKSSIGISIKRHTLLKKLEL